MTDGWTKVLTADEVKARTATIAKVDPGFAKSEAVFYETRTVNQLRVLAHQAWLCCEAEAYQLAQSYLALAA